MLQRIGTIGWIVLGLAGRCGAAGSEHWVATWAASPAPQLADEERRRAAHLEFENQTLREIVHISLGGDAVRVRLSNAYGTRGAMIGGAQIAVHSKDSGIERGSARVLTFSGRPAVEIPANAVVLSDPVQLKLRAGAELAISLFLPQATTGAAIHYAAQQTSYIGAGDATAAEALVEPVKITSWVFLAGVDVLAAERAYTVVAFGDSITDGALSTLDANHRWPDVLAGRLAGQGGPGVAVVDAGIGGNRILHDGVGNVAFGVNALARFDRDALGQPGVKYVIVLEGINDLGHAGTSAPESETVTADDLIAGLRQMIERAHERGVKVIGATLTPFEGTVFKGYFTPEKEVKRKAVNQWIRTGGAFDGVVDFDQAIRDPDNPDRMRAEYDGGDHLHPGDAGYQAMGEAVKLTLLR